MIEARGTSEKENILEDEIPNEDPVDDELREHTRYARMARRWRNGGIIFSAANVVILPVTQEYKPGAILAYAGVAIAFGSEAVRREHLRKIADYHQALEDKLEEDEI